MLSALINKNSISGNGCSPGQKRRGIFLATSGLRAQRVDIVEIVDIVDIGARFHPA
jgi:hypothetical protein